MCVLRRGEGRFGDAPDSANPPRSESAHARSAPGGSNPRLDPIPTERCPDRAAPGRGRGLRRPRPRRAQARGCSAAPRFRRAPPRPASRGLARPRCHVGLCGSRRRRCRRRQRSGGAASLAQPPECEDNDHPGRAGREPGGSRELPCWHAVPERPPSAPSLGLRAPEERRDAAPVTAGPRPCHPEWDRVLAHLPRRQPWTLHPTGDTMSSGQQPPRRVTNVGSLLLTPQENESLFSFLGKKCVVSGRDPRRHPQCPVAGSGWGDWRVGGRRGRALPGSRCGPGLQTPRALVLPSPCSPGAGRPGREPPPRAAGEQGSVTSAGQPRSSSRGPRPCCRFKLYSRPQGNFLRAPAA